MIPVADGVLTRHGCLKHPENGAREGARFVRDRTPRATEKAFDDFADGTDEAGNLAHARGPRRSR